MENELKNHIAAAIRNARKNSGHTQEDLAGLIDRTPESLSNIERGHSLPTILTLYAIANQLDVSLMDFLPQSSSAASEARTDLARKRLEASAHQLLSTLDDQALTAAIIQIKALASLSD